MNTVNVVYFSATGTTLQVVQKIAEGTGLTVKETDFTKLKFGPTPPAFPGDELVIVGLPVYVGRVPSMLVSYLRGLRGDGTPCVAVAVYGNRHFDDCLIEMCDILTEGGFSIIASAAFVGEHSFSDKLGGGRPDENDKVLALAFGQDIRNKLNTGAALLAEGQIPGNRPYRDPFMPKGPPMGPEVGVACNRCGKCANACPTGAIDQADVTQIDFAKCIRCRACAKTCPDSAIDILAAPFLEHTKHLIEVYADYKEVLTVL